MADNNRGVNQGSNQEEGEHVHPIFIELRDDTSETHTEVIVRASPRSTSSDLDSVEREMGPQSPTSNGSGTSSSDGTVRGPLDGQDSEAGGPSLAANSNGYGRAGGAEDNPLHAMRRLVDSGELRVSVRRAADGSGDVGARPVTLPVCMPVYGPSGPRATSSPGPVSSTSDRSRPAGVGRPMPRLGPAVRESSAHLYAGGSQPARGPVIHGTSGGQVMVGDQGPPTAHQGLLQAGNLSGYNVTNHVRPLSAHWWPTGCMLPPVRAEPGAWVCMLNAHLGRPGALDVVTLYNPYGTSVAHIQSLIYGAYASQSVLWCQHAEGGGLFINFNYIDARSSTDVADAWMFTIIQGTQLYTWLITGRTSTGEFIAVLDRLDKIQKFGMFARHLSVFTQARGGRTPSDIIRGAAMSGQILPDLYVDGASWTRFSNRPAGSSAMWMNACRLCHGTNYHASQFNQQ